MDDAEDKEIVAPPTANSMKTFEKTDPIQDGNAAPEVIETIESCVTKQIIHDTLDTYYVPLEIYYTRIIIDKVRFSYLNRNELGSIWEYRHTPSQNQT
jgi:hypothetical protein